MPDTIVTDLVLHDGDHEGFQVSGVLESTKGSDANIATIVVTKVQLQRSKIGCILQCDKSYGTNIIHRIIFQGQLQMPEAV